MKMRILVTAAFAAALVGPSAAFAQTGNQDKKTGPSGSEARSAVVKSKSNITNNREASDTGKNTSSSGSSSGAAHGKKQDDKKSSK